MVVRVNIVGSFSEYLSEWWKINRRSYPWRFENDPYRVFIAEYLLQRTRADAVKSIYNAFLRSFPDFRSINLAGEFEISGVIYTLGLQKRIKRLKSASKMIEEEYGGNLPLSKEKLMSIPGVGDYTASAILVFTRSGDEPLIDSNTVRILSRNLEIGGDYDNVRKSEFIHRIYNEMKGDTDPVIFGYAMIDLSALICTPNKPACHLCPLANICLFHSSHRK
jgi:A/G-specific adenine glycosylase